MLNYLKKNYPALIFAFMLGMFFVFYSDFKTFIPELLEGIKVTVFLSVIASVLALTLAFTAALLRMYAPMPFNYIALVYIEIFRGTSMLVQMFWLFFVLPYFGVELDPFVVGILALGLNIGAYGSEVVRGSIQAVPKDQWEVSQALNFSFIQTLSGIIIPQAVIRMIPPFGNLFIELLKASALVSLITISDLSFKAAQLNQLTYETTKIYSLTLFFYLLLALLITGGVRKLENIFSRYLIK